MNKLFTIFLVFQSVLFAQSQQFQIGDEYEGGYIFSIEDEGLYIADLTYETAQSYGDAVRMHENTSNYEGWYIPKSYQYFEIIDALYHLFSSNSYYWESEMFWTSDSIDNKVTRKVVELNSYNSFWSGDLYLASIIPIRLVSTGEHNNIINSKIKNRVSENIVSWQEKGEFEKTIDYKLRVTNKSRSEKIIALENIILDSLKFEFINDVNINDFSLSTYDADNEIFNLNSIYGDFPINVPISTAKIFKENFYSSSILDIDVVVKGGQFIISDFIVCSFDINTIESLRSQLMHIVGAANYIKSIDIKFSDYLKLESNRKSLYKWLTREKYYSSNSYVDFFNNLSLFNFRYSLENKLQYSETEITYNFSDIEIEGVENYMGDISTLSSKSTISVGCKVDVDIPSNYKVNNRYALIIGNEDYTSYQSGLSTEQNVEFAENDARIFKEYALRTLGVKDDNMYYLINATSGQMKQRIALVSSIIKQLGNKAELIFYYAGHGYPDELTKIPYLIPVDISANDLSGGINLLDVYKTFSETNASRVTVFLDACFTGGARNVGLVASRGIKISPKQDALVGNVVVFSASSDTETSLPYTEQSHGMFTYFLLDKLQKSNGKCTYSDLFNYLDSEVSLHSLKVNEKIQTPKLSTSSSIQNKWHDWRF